MYTHFISLSVKPLYDGFLLSFVVAKELTQKVQGAYLAAIDLGVENLATLVTNEGHVYLYKGGIVKSINQLYNKKKAHYTSILQKQTKQEKVFSKRLTNLSRERYFKLKDYFHKMSKDIIKKCINHHIGTLIIGENKYWKNEVDIGKQNNQNFVGIPFDIFKKQLIYKGEEVAIKVVFVEEAYTSKADFLSNDDISKQFQFSGERVKRGLYHSGTGTILNADVNAACNIMKKYDPTAFSKIHDFKYLNKPHVINNLYNN